jgi:GcrA cell cycle regulator
MFGTPSTWNEKNVSLLRQLWAEGHSGEKIARTIGGFTRSAIMGKIHRMGLPTRRSAAEAARRKRHGSVTRPSRTQQPLYEQQSKGLPAAIAEVMPPEGGVHILDLTSNHCRAVIGKGDDGLQRYCGAPKRRDIEFRDRLAHSAYCAAHSALYYQPLR